MSSFRVIEHRVPAQHIREYRQATAKTQEDILHLSVKQYIPVPNQNPRPGDVTIIGAHANGFPKELYEPLWEDLLEQSMEQGWRIRSIWMADVSHQGQSDIMNESLLGNDPSWNDHARDLLHLINVKRAEMPRPIVGIGHSMGGAQLAYLSLTHPRLLTSLIFLDPTIGTGECSSQALASEKYGAAVYLSKRRLAVSRSSHQAYDKWLRYGLRDVPTISYPNAEPPAVTLATTVSQEVFTFVRPNYEQYGVDGKPVNRVTHADVNNVQGTDYPFYRSESPYVYRHLPELRPSALCIFGGASPISTPEMNENKLAQTGTGIGSSGGPAEGRVKGVTLE